MNQFKDRNKTNIRIDHITSFYQCNEVTHDMRSGGCYPAIALTVGSASLRLVYDKKEDRDSDLQLIYDQTREPRT